MQADPLVGRSNALEGIQLERGRPNGHADSAAVGVDTDSGLGFWTRVQVKDATPQVSSQSEQECPKAQPQNEVLMRLRRAAGIPRCNSGFKLDV